MTREFTQPSEFDRPSHWRLAVLAVLVLAALGPLYGMLLAPLDDHEAYVVGTAQEMRDRGDWVVPHFNGEPRLTKPPLNYWLTGAVAAISGDARIRPWHGRLPSVLAGLCMVLLTLRLGARLYGREIALLAGLMLASTNGYFEYAASARPEMVYAFLCSLGMAGFITALHAPDNSLRQLLSAYGMWLAYALATLAKGPHIPAMFLAACLLYCALSRTGWRRALRSLRPVTGLMLLALLALPWWLILKERLPASALETSQLSGTLISQRLSPELGLYYLYIPALKLFMPWVLLLPALVVLRRLTHEQRSNALLLALLYLVMVIALSFNNHYRAHYPLPGLMPVCLLLAMAVTAGLQLLHAGQALRLARIWLGFVGLGTGLLLVTGFHPRFAGTGTAQAGLVLALVLWVCVLGAATYLSRQRKLEPGAHILASGLLLLPMYAGITGVLADVSERRDRRQEIARVLGEAGAGTPVVSWGGESAVYVYHARRSIPTIYRIEELAAALGQAPGTRLLLITTPGHLAALPAGLHITPLLEPRPGARTTVAAVAGVIAPADGGQEGRALPGPDRGDDE
jgi:4-amino-4-deoxy-L-arabinose transferase-like glycosyltransferase